MSVVLPFVSSVLSIAPELPDRQSVSTDHKLVGALICRDVNETTHASPALPSLGEMSQVVQTLTAPVDTLADWGYSPVSATPHRRSARFMEDRRKRPGLFFVVPLRWVDWPPGSSS